MPLFKTASQFKLNSFALGYIEQSPQKKNENNFMSELNSRLKHEDNELSCVDLEDKFIYKRINLHVGGVRGLLKEKALMLINYLEGTIEIDKLNLTPENGAYFLKLSKFVDLSFKWRQLRPAVQFKRSTFSVREQILKLCSPQMTTSEAFTFTLNRSKMHDPTFLMNPKHWVVERVGSYARIIANEFILARSLSMRLSYKLPVIFALKGNTGASKTTLIQEMFGRKRPLRGVLSPDSIKASLKRRTLLLNKQVHEEGAALFANFQQEMLVKVKQMSLIIDTRLSCMEAFKACMVKPFDTRSGNGRIIDIDVSLERSVMRVLVRDRFGIDPCVPLDSIVKGFVQTRQNRLKMIELIKMSKHIDQYELYCWDKDGKQTLIAQKKEDKFSVFAEGSFLECTHVPKSEEIDQTFKKVITQSYIDEAISSNIIYSHQRKKLDSWIGKTLLEAMEQHIG